MDWSTYTFDRWESLTVSDGGRWIWNGMQARRMPARPVAPSPPPWYARLWAAVVDAIDILMIR